MFNILFGKITANVSLSKNSFLTLIFKNNEKYLDFKPI